MANTNIFNRLQNLFPPNIRTVVTITAINSDGTSTATTLGGTSVIVQGTSVAVGQRAFVVNGEITRQAPNHTIQQVTV